MATKDEFKKGCEAGGHSFVEHADGSYQCNLRSGGVISCNEAGTHCTSTTKISTSVAMEAISAGKIEMIIPRREKPSGY